MNGNIAARYLIVGPTRSGTTAAHLMLAGHPQVSTLVGELSFSQLAAGLKPFSKGEYVTDDEEAQGRAALFDAITSIHAKSSTRVLGAKATINSVDAATNLADTVKQYLASLKIIVMVRTDLVAHFYSRNELRKTGVAHSWRDPGKRRRGTSSVDRWLLARSAIATVDTYRRLQEMSTFVDYLEVNYEGFARDNLATYRDLLTFLELDYVEPTWHVSRKLHDAPESNIHDYTALSGYVAEVLKKHAGGTLSPKYMLALRVYARGRRIVDSSSRRLRAAFR